MIKKIFINSFGKFNNYELEFKNGINVIDGQNESGKSTILNFILMILYGNQSKSKDLLQNERRRYKPWNHEIMKGFIVIEKDGVDYKIERTFLNSNSTDIVDVYNLNTGSSIDIPNPKMPGEYFFDLGYEAFTKTLFIFSESIVINNENKRDEINTKLINLVTTGQEDISFKNVISKLDDKIYNIESKSGKSGKLVEVKKKIDILRLEMENALSDEKEKEELSDRISKLNQRKKELMLELEKMQILLSKKNDRQEIIYSRKDYENKRSIYTATNEKREIEIIDEKIAFLNGENSFTKINIFDISVISFIVSFFLFKVNKYLALFIALFSAISYLLNYSKKEKNKKEKLNILSQRREELLKKVENLDKEYDENENEIYYMNKAIDEIDAYFSLRNIDISKVQYENIERLKDEIYTFNDKITSIETMAKERFSGKKNFSTIEYDLKLTEEEKIKLEREIELYTITKELIQKSFKNLEDAFAGKLNEIASKIIYDITNGKYSKLYISNDFLIKFEDSKTKDLIDWKYLSSGTIDQFYLSLRLALIKLIVESRENRILLIDDIFIRFDENRMRNAMKLLSKNSNDFNQILLFTSKEMHFENNSYNHLKI